MIQPLAVSNHPNVLHPKNIMIPFPLKRKAKTKKTKDKKAGWKITSR